MFMPDSLYSRKPVKIPPNTIDTHSSRDRIATSLLKPGGGFSMVATFLWTVKL
jgi:hypothetical protein